MTKQHILKQVANIRTMYKYNTINEQQQKELLKPLYDHYMKLGGKQQ